MGRTGVLRAYARVARLEYLPAELLLILIPLLLAFELPHALGNRLTSVAEAVIVFFLLYLTGFIVNAITDVEVDRTYSTFKSSVSEAVERLGRRRLSLLVVVQVLAALGLSLHLAWLLQQWLLLGLVGLGLFLGLGYSLPPFQFKTAGAGHGLALALSAFFIPMVFLSIVVTNSVDPLILLLITGFTLAQYALEFGNQAADFEQDRKADLSTPPVRYSVPSTLSFGLVLMVLGVALLVGSLFALSSSVGGLGRLHPALAGVNGLLLMLVIVLVGYAGPFRAMLHLHGMAILRGEVDPSVVRHARWQAAGSLSTMLACALLFGAAVLGPVVAPPAVPFVDEVPQVSFAPDEVWVNAGDATILAAATYGDTEDGSDLHTDWVIAGGFGTYNQMGQRSYNHTFTTPGDYQVTVTVTDGAGNRAQDQMVVHVVQLDLALVSVTVDKRGLNEQMNLTLVVKNDKEKRSPGSLEVSVSYRNLPADLYHNEQILAHGQEWVIRATVDVSALDTAPEVVVHLQTANGQERQMVVSATDGH